MRLFRRREPLHERLAREGGLRPEPLSEPGPPGGGEGDPSARPGDARSAEDAPRHGWMETGIHGVQRPRQWDSVVTVEAEGVAGDRVRFVALPDDTLLVEEGDEVDPLAAALDELVQPPYRAEGIRRGERRWAVGIRRIEVVDLPDDPGGEEVELTASGGERTLLVDGQAAFGSIPALERLGAARGESYVVRARRLDGATWEVEVSPL